MTAAPEFKGLIEPVARSLLGEPNRSLSTKGELRYGSHGSLSIDLAHDRWFDHELQEGGGVLDLVTHETGTREPGEWLEAHGFLRPRANGGRRSRQRKAARRLEAVYDYLDETGELLFQALRFALLDEHGMPSSGTDGKPDKAFSQRRPRQADDGPGDEPWIWSLKGVRLVPYRLPELMETLAQGQPYFIVEGEKCVDALAERGVPATTNPMGAGKWPDSFGTLLRGSDAIGLPDNDLAGRRHMQAVGENLVATGSRFRLVELPGLKPKGDVVDWLNAGHAVEDLYELAERAGTFQNDQAGTSRPDASRIIPLAHFMRGFSPPDYLIEGILQKRFFYSLTGVTGAGKTSIALLLGLHLALGRSVGTRPVEQGRVLYLAGENPDDVRMRMIASAEHYAFDIDSTPLFFMPAVFSIPDVLERIRTQAEEVGGFSLVIVDTSPAYFEGEEENNNAQMGEHARSLRNLTTIPGEPAVLALCHPVKHAGNSNLLPRGGGAFVAEVDGNLVTMRDDTRVTLDWQGKLRGPGFDPLSFELQTVTAAKLVDSKGRSLPSVIAVPISEAEEKLRETDTRRAEDVLLVAMFENEGASIAELAEAAGFMVRSRDGGLPKPYKSKVFNILRELARDKFVAQKRRRWGLTATGKTEAERIAQKVVLLEAQKGG